MFFKIFVFQIFIAICTDVVLYPNLAIYLTYYLIYVFYSLNCYYSLVRIVLINVNVFMLCLCLCLPQPSNLPHVSFNICIL